jgi:hypothetical protein
MHESYGTAGAGVDKGRDKGRKGTRDSRPQGGTMEYSSGGTREGGQETSQGEGGEVRVLQALDGLGHAIGGTGALRVYNVLGHGEEAVRSFPLALHAVLGLLCSRDHVLVLKLCARRQRYCRLENGKFWPQYIRATRQNLIHLHQFCKVSPMCIVWLISVPLPNQFDTENRQILFDG